MYLGDLAGVLGSSQSAFLISRPCSLLLRHPVNMGCFLFYFIQRSFVIQYPCPWVGTASFLYCESLASVWHSEREYARTLGCVTPEWKGERKRSLRDIRVQRAKIPASQASLGLTSSVSIPDWFCQEIKVVFATQDFAGEMGPIISSSTKDADRESGEGFVETNTDHSESRSWNM